jgi:Derlin-2/3
MEFFNSIPPFTKYWGILILAFSLLTTLAVPPALLVFDPSAVLHGEIWRLFTSPFVLGRLDFQLIIQMFLPLSLIRTFEQSQYPNRLSVLVFMFIFMSIITFILSGIFDSGAIGSSLLTGFTWVCSRHYGNQVVQLFMILPVPLKWLPLVDLLMSFLQGGSLRHGIIGIVAGHTVFFLFYVLPVVLDRPILQTPPILSRLLDVTAAANGQPDPGYAFHGGGRRLGG